MLKEIVCIITIICFLPGIASCFAVSPAKIHLYSGRARAKGTRLPKQEAGKEKRPGGRFPKEVYNLNLNP